MGGGTSTERRTLESFAISKEEIKNIYNFMNADIRNKTVNSIISKLVKRHYYLPLFYQRHVVLLPKKHVYEFNDMAGYDPPMFKLRYLKINE